MPRGRVKPKTKSKPLQTNASNEALRQFRKQLASWAEYLGYATAGCMYVIQFHD